MGKEYILPLILILPWCHSFSKLSISAFSPSPSPSPTTSTSTIIRYLSSISEDSGLLVRNDTRRKHDNKGKEEGDGDGEMEQGNRWRRRKRQKQQQVYLFSLNWILENDSEYYLKKHVRRLWEWKDITLGDGRDFFVPKPKTLMTLQQYLLANIPDITECSIISNCARLEVLCCCNIDNVVINNIEDDKKEETRRQQILSRKISNCFVIQMNHYDNISKHKSAWTKMWTQLPINIDRPESVLTRKMISTTRSIPNSESQLSSSLFTPDYDDSWWTVIVGTEAILSRICKISAGMASRPRRPERPVVFRPYSSRDAHVLLQLKRTRENISFSSSSEGDDNYNYINDKSSDSYSAENQGDDSTRTRRRRRRLRKILPAILDCALRAGKAARNHSIVPEIKELREMTSAESSVCCSSDLITSQVVANAAYEKGIRPLINDCTAKLDDSTDNIEQIIVEFRRNAFDLLMKIEKEEQKNITCDNNDNANKNVHRELKLWLNRRLHGPTIELRSRSQQRHNRQRRNNSIIEKEIVLDYNNISNDDNQDDSDNDYYVEDCLDEIKKELQLEIRSRHSFTRK